jgi:4-hydroxy-2-oxoglutarate aldolase
MTNADLDLQGIFPPLTTPFTSTQDLDLAGLKANIERWNRTGLAGYVVVGSTGESVYLGLEEKIKLWETAREATGAGKILIAGTGCEATQDTIDLTRRAAAAGYQAALIRTPSYFKSQMTDSALERHFRAVADASPIPILLYSVPQFTGLALGASLVARLADHPNIIGIKDSAGDVQRIADTIRLAPPEFQVLVGSATTLYPSLCLGARGAVLAVACALPELCVALHQAFVAGNHEEARALQRRLHEPTVAVTSRYGIAGLKFAMELQGYVGGPARAPLEPLSEGGKQEIRRILGSLEPSR